MDLHVSLNCGLLLKERRRKYSFNLRESAGRSWPVGQTRRTGWGGSTQRQAGGSLPERGEAAPPPIQEEEEEESVAGGGSGRGGGLLERGESRRLLIISAPKQPRLNAPRMGSTDSAEGGPARWDGRL
ncbi:hypothetical protein R5R35_011914 [Gryllus longicercus]|uniref:Uncharacterized protein n=1 Tax=Gryllus longicercus TaxID=2509291 RepID=A0AAN9ZGW6_9ORTH